MDELDPNMVYEVPDTPDRLTLRRPIDRSSDPSRETVDTGEGTNWYLSHGDLWHPSKIYLRRHRDSSRHDGRSAAPNSPEDLFRQADLARSMLEPIESKSELNPIVISSINGESTKMGELGEKSLYPISHPTTTRCKDLRRRVANPEHKASSTGSSHTSRLLLRRPVSGGGITLTAKPVLIEENTSKLDEDNLELLSRDEVKEVDLCHNSRPRNGCTSLSRLPKNDNQSKAGCQHPTNPVDLPTCSQSAQSSGQDNGNGMNLCRNIEPNRILARSLRSTGQRRLVRNGCISPSNIERCRSIGKAKHDNIENNGIPSHEIHIISPDSDDRRAEKMKGKLTVDDTVVSDDQHVGDNSRLGRAVSLPGKEVCANADEESGTDSFEDEGWRIVRPHSREPSIFPFSNETARISENGEATSHPFHRTHETARGHRSSPTAVCDDHDDTSLQHQSNTILVRDSQTRNMRGKRKFSLTRRPTGECSTSTSCDPGTSNLQYSGQASNLRSARGLRPQHDGIGLGPVIEVDDLQSPEVVYNHPSEHNTISTDHSVDRARQLESDEILARQLQEELYNETPRTGGMEEIDATIGWSLLEEEDGYRASSRRRDQPHRRNTSSARATNHARRTISNTMAQLRRESNRPVVTGDMGLEMRLDFLEAMGLAFDDRNDTQSNNFFHRIQRDFSENDYEMLLALDENNNHAGASESRINNLPQSVIQNDNPEETCAVCLEAPSAGDAIRHLPCLHKFHKECIDTWLRRRASCPVCKSDIY